MTTLQELISLDGHELTRRLVRPDVELGDLSKQELVAMVELLPTRLTRAATTFTLDDWRVGEEAIDRLFAVAETAGAIDRNESFVQRINLSVALLRRVSPQAGIAILDPDSTYELFMEAVPMPVAEARELATNWRDLDIAVIRRLRFAKNLTAPIFLLRKWISDSAKAANLRAWEDVFPILP